MGTQKMLANWIVLSKGISETDKYGVAYRFRSGNILHLDLFCAMGPSEKSGEVYGPLLRIFVNEWNKVDKKKPIILK